MKKDCPKHGHFEDVMSIDPAFFKRLESLYPGRDFVDPEGRPARPRHLVDQVRARRGAHDRPDEPLQHDVQPVLHGREPGRLRPRARVGRGPEDPRRRRVDQAAPPALGAVLRRRADAVAALPPGDPLRAASSATSPSSARPTASASRRTRTSRRQAAEAGLRFAYLQFDGVGNEHNQHRKVGNLYDVKLRAIENLHKHGIDVTLVATIVNGVNNDQVGDILQFAIDEHRQDQRASRSSRCPSPGATRTSTTRRANQQRYTLSHLAHDVKDQAGIGEPHARLVSRSRRPDPFSDLKDLLGGLESEWGSFKCGCHPNCGIGTMLLVDEKTKEAVTVPSDPGRGPHARATSSRSPTRRGARRGPRCRRASRCCATCARRGSRRRFRRWKLMQDHGRPHRRQARLRRDSARYPTGASSSSAGMWFQDLFNYDFRRTEMCIIPYATQMGEISFCAYNTGVGWRKIIEEMFQTATLAEWYKTHGRHEVYARGRNVPLPVLPGQTVPMPMPASPAAPARARRGLDRRRCPSTARRASSARRGPSPGGHEGSRVSRRLPPTPPGDG